MKSYRELQTELEQSGKANLAILPIGCYEQHGPVLPLDTDNVIAQAAAGRLAERLVPDFHCHIFPLLSYTTTEPNRAFCGTVSVAADPFRAYLRAVCQGILESDFQALLLLNSHGSIVGSIKEIAFECVYQQYSAKISPVRPVLALNVFDYDSIIEEQLQQKVGRHADWKEFLLLWDVLGPGYFTADRMKGLADFAGSHPFDDAMPKVIGIPAEFRTTDGVQGRPLPQTDDYDQLSARVWDITLESLAHSTKSELQNFMEKYAVASR